MTTMKSAATADAYPLSDMASATVNPLNPYNPKNVTNVATPQQQSTTRLASEASDGHQDDLRTSWVLPMNNSHSRRGSIKRSKNIFRGWRLVVFNSWLNVLLVLVPISLVLNRTMHEAHSLVFAFSILSLVPLVKLHDVATGELAIRIGGHKTGLLNASMSNLVEMVIAISALRKCELQVVQSALIGSILSRLLLVLGLCFFAGGMRFSEQGFDATATQIHSSLMSISVGALVLPAAYHFTISRDTTSASEQGQNILQMSYGVSIVLLFIYGSYLIFQLGSHTHLYHDKHNKKSRRLSMHHIVKVPSETTKYIKNARKRLFASVSNRDTPGNDSHTANSPTLSQDKPYLERGDDSPSTSNTKIGSPSSELHCDDKKWQPGSSTVRLVGGSEDNVFRNEINPTDNHHCRIPNSTRSEDQPCSRSPTPNNRQSYRASRVRQPQLSWTLTIGLLLTVTIIVIVTAEDLVESLDGISSTISKEWAGLVLLPGVTAVAECMTAVNVSVRDELTLSISVAVGSSIQTALFVFPSMVILGWITHKPLSLLLNPFQALVLYLSVQIMNYVVADGKSNWLEGVILICLYIIIAVSFWFYPSASLPDSLAICSV